MQFVAAMRFAVLCAVVSGLVATELAEEALRPHHHKHRHHRKHRQVPTGAAAAPAATAPSLGQPGTPSAVSVDAVPGSSVPDSSVIDNMRLLEQKLTIGQAQPQVAPTASPALPQPAGTMAGTLEVNSPLPDDFAERFAQAVSMATQCEPAEVSVVSVRPMDPAGDISELTFQAPPDVVQSVREQAADPDSKLAAGPLRVFLMEKDEGASEPASDSPQMGVEETQPVGGLPAPSAVLPVPTAQAQQPAMPGGLDVDMGMPYGDLEAFGREDTAQELTEQSVQQSNDMVDQLERAEVAEEKRSVFRALTRLRGAAISSFDGVARSQTGNIDGYNKLHKWRLTHPIRHLAEEESDVAKWAFPDGADF